MNPRPLGGVKSMQRKMYIDVLRSIAILFMIEVHASAQLSPPNISVDSILVLVVASIGGLAAPLFITISGWGVHHSLLGKFKKSITKNSIIYWMISRAVFLLLCQLIVNIIANHVFNWYTPGVLSLLAICTILSVPLAKAPIHVKVILFSLLLITPILNNSFIHMNGNWSFVISANTPLEWIERLLFNGTYPLFPWATFFVLGSILHDSNTSFNHKTMILGIFISVSYMVFALMTNTTWALTNGDALLTFFPASVAFIITANTTVLIAFIILEKYDKQLQKFSFLESFSKIGNLSLTIYLVHFIPLRILSELKIENWGIIEAIIITLLFTIIWWPLSIIHNNWFKKYSVENLLRWIVAKKNIPKTSVRQP
jgi:uncharacterized membrane protein